MKNFKKEINLAWIFFNFLAYCGIVKIYVTSCRLVVHYPFFPAKYSNVTGPPQHREMRNDLGMCFLPKSPVSGYVAFFFS